MTYLLLKILLLLKQQLLLHMLLQQQLHPMYKQDACLDDMDLMIGQGKQ
jgi:hypothetical protein